MKRTEFKLLAITTLLSGFSVGYIHAETHSEAVRMYVSQQENECKGVVLDETGETVIGASVLVKGTSNGTITDLDGNFVIQNVKKGDVIVVSYVGYKNVETVWDGTNLRILLKSNAEELDEVVVVGYGVQKKVNLTGAVSSVKGEAFETRPVVDATQGLQGMVPGLNVSNSNSGRPGATGTLSLRGQEICQEMLPLMYWWMV